MQQLHESESQVLHLECMLVTISFLFNHVVVCCFPYDLFQIINCKVEINVQHTT